MRQSLFRGFYMNKIHLISGLGDGWGQGSQPKDKICLIFPEPKEVLRTKNNGGTNYDVKII